MPRTNNKAREVAYEILGVPGCLEKQTDSKMKQKPKKNQGDFNIDLNNGDIQRP